MSEDNKETGRSHEFELLLDAPIEEVWRALTEGERIQSWFAPEARVEPGEGGRIFVSWGPGMEATAPITIWEPGKRVGWVERGDTAAPRVVEFTLEREGTSTRLRLVHSGFGHGASFDEEYESTHGGWSTFLAALRYLVERRWGLPAAHRFRLALLKEAAPVMWGKLTQAMGVDAGALHAGAAYAVRLPDGATFHGEVWAIPRPGYALLRVRELDDSLLALFVEGFSGQCCLTTSWYLYGTAASADSPLLGSWSRFYDAFTKGE